MRITKCINNLTYLSSLSQVTPDRVHILDFHPRYDDIVVGCGFSGNAGQINISAIYQYINILGIFWCSVTSHTMWISLLFIGTGFKLGPVTGEMLADMVTGRKTKYDVTPFLANRFHNETNIQAYDGEDKTLSKI